MSLTVAGMRTLVRQFARNAVDSSAYNNTSVDNAIMLPGDEWCRITRATKASSDMPLSIGAQSFVAPNGFLPEYFLDALLFLSGKPVMPLLLNVPYEEVLAAMARQGPNNVGTPRLLAFDTAATAMLFPLPDAVYTVRMRWWKPFTSWTAGDETSGTTGLTFNLPDDHLKIIAAYGARYYLQKNEPENAAGCEKDYAHFLAEAAQFAQRNAGGLGGSVSLKTAPCRGGAQLNSLQYGSFNTGG